ncbi:CCR4-NOT transcription complex subunit 1-like isoform X1 [Amphibalanus amphitrite]|uniref:CCR4-NOT transcription complex subunit 1-like isoform X1 n=1 Tax=Amphibalanus amphitrite TaxID=1232801 RepID=UPI001C907D3C|nr:CCR4-NOT transcription complex subunit 1-like isoform X1 [Amphibalanus amphitrite]XP_043234310.1 CCR4-NOT transcription complex subunit 1-like isoform X1 [Amphibalanus amphitrite]XP_043234311.1 CCR4-NOT transcription complex subunit 1-like isoform X2 [Amphibalanus amphitrite]XP_043234312.1 CCR4-NOT transcription complex subunit 1-like isoform X1 [Amphibalanus amphitrite]
MNLDSSSYALIQISNIVANLTKKNFKVSSQEIQQLVEAHGSDAQIHLLRCLFTHVDWEAGGRSGGPTNKDNPQLQLLQQLCASLATRPNFVHTLCYAVDHRTFRRGGQTARLLHDLPRTLKLKKAEEVAFAIALLHSRDPETVKQAEQFVQQRLPELVRNYVESADCSGVAEEGGLHESSPELLHRLVSWLLYAPPEQLDKAADSQEALVEAVRKDLPRGVVPAVLAPLIYPDCADIPVAKIAAATPAAMAANLMDSSLADFVLEVGYVLCSSVEECRRHLVNHGASELTAPAVARCLGAMAKTYTGLQEQIPIQSLQSPASIWASDKTTDGPQTWNVEVFVQAVHELTPALQWKEVVYHLDHPGFQVKDRTALRLITQALQLGLQLQGVGADSFPVQVLYRVWKNADSQLSYIDQILKNPDVFCLADYQCYMVDVSQLKVPPEKDNKELNTWRCTELMQLLLHLAESGHTCFVQELLKYPLQHGPDILALNLLAAGSSSHLAQELLSSLFVVFLNGHHPNSAAVLHQAWHTATNTSGVRTMLMHTMAEWYRQAENDQGRLSRILDVAQDLKALSLLLSYQALPFVIDLACLASRREYLKLDKWLSDKIHEHGEPFIAATVKFLQRRVPQLSGGPPSELELPPKAPLPADLVTTVLSVLHARVNSAGVGHELSEAILTMMGNASQLLQLGRQRPPPPGVARPPPAGPPRPPDPSPFGAGPLGSQLFPSSAGGDSLVGGLTATISGLGLGGPAASTPGASTPSAGLGLSSPFSLQGSAAGSAAAVGGARSAAQASLLASLTPPAISGLFGPGGGGAGAGPSTAQHAAAALHGASRTVSHADVSPFPNESAGALSKEVEEEANSNFQRIYNHPPHPTLSIEEVLDMLKRFQDSNVQHEREVFACMLRSLMDEYKFFPQYPDKELYITAQLFGGIIEHNLVTNYMGLGLALRYVLDAVKKKPGSNMYNFGIVALDRFKHRLREYPQYCQHLATVEHFGQFPRHLVDYIDCGMRSQEPLNRPEGPVLPPHLQALVSGSGSSGSAAPTPPASSTPAPRPSSVASSAAPLVSGRPSIANTTNIETLLSALPDVPIPVEAVQDKVGFIFNNLSQLNLQQKCEELLDIITKEHWPWFSQYVVVRRLSIEPNFHTLYANFVDATKRAELIDTVVREVHRNIQVLLRADKGVEKFSDRTILKNLGHWLGLMTIAKSKPILQVDLDLKALVVEAYHLGMHELLYIVPFVAKVLESCAKSKIFKPPNPWTMGIMNLLAELHQERDLKLNLKFEVEVLCKTLSLDVNELKPTDWLHDPQRLQRLPIQLKRPVPAPTPVPALPPPTAPPPTAPSVPPPAAPPPQLSAAGGSGEDTTTSGGPELPPTAAAPRFTVGDINTSSIAGLAAHITINPALPLFQTHPAMRQIVLPAVERTVQDWLPRAVERNCKLAVSTAEQLVKKDFSMDGDDLKMRTAAHQLVMSLTAGLTLINCRDHLTLSISSNIRASMLSIVRSATPQQKEFIEQTANMVAADNVELACCFIQKTAIEKSILEIDKRLAAEFELRKMARAEGRRYCDPSVASYQEARMPEPIRLQPLSGQQMSVYEEFTRAVPGFAPSEAPVPPQPQLMQMPPRSAQPPPPLPLRATQPPPPLSAPGDELSQLLEKVSLELQALLQQLHPAAAASAPAQQLSRLAEEVNIARGSRDVAAHIRLVKLAVDGLLEQSPQVSPEAEPVALRLRDSHQLVLRALQEPRCYGPQWVQKYVTSSVAEWRGDVRLNGDTLEALVRARLISLPQLDSQLALAVEAANYSSVFLAMQLLQVFFIDARDSIVTENDLANTIEAMTKVAQQQGSENIANLLEVVRGGGSGTGTGSSGGHDTPFSAADRNPGGPTAHIHKGISQARDFDDPPGLQEKTEFLLREWVQLYHAPSSGRESTKAFSQIVYQMNMQGILKTDDLITRFFRHATQMCVDMCYRTLNDQAAMTPTMVRNKCFRTLDAFVRLIALLVKHSGESPNAVSKINLLNKVLGIVTGVLLQDHEIRKTEFQQLPYHRIFIMLLLELNAPDPVLEAINFQVLTAFCNVLHILRPEKAPAFAYAWLDIVSHRVFIGRMLAVTPQHKGWGPYAQLLIDLFNFLSPFLRNAELAKPITILYRGCLRVLLVLLHDFPEFLCDYHYNFCDVIPPNCIQMRNLVLSAFPRNLPPPDPFAGKLQVDMIPEIRQAPMIQTNYASLIQPPSFKNELDTYLNTRTPVTFVTDLRSTLQASAEPGCRYNIQLMNALVLYVGTEAIAAIQAKGLQPNKQTITHSSHMDIFQSLAVDTDTEGRYLFLNAIANQLRYPNSHTNYFLHLILYLFAEANTPAIQEQITRVLLERLIVNRPHPWGLLITFIELIKNPTFDFWSHEFVHCAPEIEKLFDSVARSCAAQGQKVSALRAAVAGQQPSPSVGGAE